MFYDYHETFEVFLSFYWIVQNSYVVLEARELSVEETDKQRKVSELNIDVCREEELSKHTTRNRKLR